MYFTAKNQIEIFFSITHSKSKSYKISEKNVLSGGVFVQGVFGKGGLSMGFLSGGFCLGVFVLIPPGNVQSRFRCPLNFSASVTHAHCMLGSLRKLTLIEMMYICSLLKVWHKCDAEKF